jgi:hypothetical protein
VPDEGTRIYRNEGDHFAMQRWFYAICEFVGPCVSPGGAAVYAGVTRAGVYKRMRAGKITAFCFHIIGKKKTLFGGEKKLKQWPLVYIPVEECKAWDKELHERVARIEAAKPETTDPEDEAALEEADPGIDAPSHDFLNYDPKDKGKKVSYPGGFASLLGSSTNRIPSPSFDEMDAFNEQLMEEERLRKAKKEKENQGGEKEV